MGAANATLSAALVVMGDKLALEQAFALTDADNPACLPGVADRVTFQIAPAAGYSGTGYDLVTMSDCLHDMGDPAGAARHVRSTLKPDGTWMIVEPDAGDRVEDNLNPAQARP
jgi:hypothetical protein